MFMYDPVNYGTPLMMLQIPPASIQKIQEKASDANCKLTNYTQDCRSFSDLKKYVSSEDWSVACRATLDVGYICKKCRVVFPGRSACTAHQQAICCHGTNNAAEFDNCRPQVGTADVRMLGLSSPMLDHLRICYALFSEQPQNGRHTESKTTILDIVRRCEGVRCRIYSKQ